MPSPAYRNRLRQPDSTFLSHIFPRFHLIELLRSRHYPSRESLKNHLSNYIRGKPELRLSVHPSNNHLRLFSPQKENREQHRLLEIECSSWQGMEQTIHQLLVLFIAKYVPVLSPDVEFFFSFILVGKRVASWHRLERSAVGKETPRQLSSCFLVDDALVEGKYRTEPRRGRPFEQNYSLTNFEWGCTTGMFEHIHETGAFRSTC